MDVLDNRSNRCRIATRISDPVLLLGPFVEQTFHR